MVIMARMEQFKGDEELEGSLLNEVRKLLVLEKKKKICNVRNNILQHIRERSTKNNLVELNFWQFLTQQVVL